MNPSLTIDVPVLQTQSGEGLPYPTYATKGSSGLDLLAANDGDVTVSPGKIELIPVGISLALPEGFEGQVRPRSGLALRHGLTMVNAPGTIDADYRGEIKVIVTVLGSEPFTIERGMRIGQLVIAPVARAVLKPVETLAVTDRGEGGFGHTGLGGEGVASQTQDRE